MGLLGILTRLKRSSRPVRHALGGLLLHLLSALASHLPLSALQAFGRGAGSLAFTLTRLNPSARLALERRLARVEPHPQRREGLARGGWRDLGQRASEWLAGSRALSLVTLSPKVARWCEEARGAEERGERWVCLTAHFGHWELMGGALAARGVPFIAAAAGERSGAMGRWVSAQRARLGVQTMRPRQAHRALRALMERGGVRALLIDHPSRGARSRPLMFLGDEAPTLCLPSDLIKRARERGETRVLWLYAKRLEEGLYEVQGQELSAYQDPVLEATHLLEQLVKEAPEQWLWLHDRWGERALTSHPSSFTPQTTHSRSRRS